MACGLYKNRLWTMLSDSTQEDGVLGPWFSSQTHLQIVAVPLKAGDSLPEPGPHLENTFRVGPMGAKAWYSEQSWGHLEWYM